MELGVFIPIGNNGWLISTTSPQYLPSFELNRIVVEKAERYGFEFALSMVQREAIEDLDWALALR
jgi:pyrimidine oxygenase